MPSNLYNPDGTRTELRIKARSRRTYHMGGEPRGGLFTEPTKGEKWKMHERARARRDAAASMPSTAAVTAAPAKPQAASMPSTAAVTAAPAKPQADGMLVPGPSGSSVWKTKAELDEQRKTKEMADASRRAGGTTAGANGMFGDMMRVVKKGFDAANQLRKTQDRNYARSRVASEKKYGPITGADSAMFRERSRKSGVLDKADPETERVLNS